MEDKKVTFRPLRQKDGTSEFEEFYWNLTMKDRQKLFSVIVNVEQYGLRVAINQKWVKKLENDLYELRSQAGNNIQRLSIFRRLERNI
ncbi:hypothetical protein [Lactovum odontotermitis]